MAKDKDEKDSAEELVLPQTPTALTTPCSLVALENWLKGVRVLTPGLGGGVTVTTTATSVGVA
jgi:hypothetical protein